MRNGTIVKPSHSMPWLVEILVGDYVWGVCTGSIIGKKHVLTAGHCFHWGDLAITHVAVGAHDLRELGTVEEKIRIEKFEFFTDDGPQECPLIDGQDDCYYDRDIAVITLVKDVLQSNNPYIGKARLGIPSDTDCLDCRGSCRGTFDASGWGIDTINPSMYSNFFQICND